MDKDLFIYGKLIEKATNHPNRPEKVEIARYPEVYTDIKEISEKVCSLIENNLGQKYLVFKAVAEVGVKKIEIETKEL